MSTTLVSQSERPPPAPAGTGARKLTERAFRIRESGIIVVLVLFVAVTASIQPRFLNITNIQFILVNTTVFALLALGETMVVISRNYDLSVGSVLGLSAYLSASLFGGHPGFPIPLAFLAGLGIGLGCGLLNGIMVAAGRVPSLVVTLATLYIFRGIDILIVGGKEVVANSLPSAFLEIPKATVLGIPSIAIAIAVVIAIGAYYLRSFRSGRELYAMGSNPDAARLAGIPVGRRVFVAFTVSGAIAGVAGVLWAAQYGTIDSTAGTGYELQVISAVVVGGVAIFGGSGSAVGAALGALLLNTISSALYVLGISPFWDQAIFGFLLLLAITLDRFISVRLTAAAGLKTGLKVFVIPKNLGNNYFTTADSAKTGGAIAALSALGETGTETSGTAATPASQIPAIQAAISKGANALIVSATDPTALCPTLNAAMKRGITVVTYDSDAPGCRDVFINQASTAQIGTSEVDVLAKQINQTGDIAIVSATASATNQNAWIGYMKQELKKYPKMKLVSTVYGNDDPTTATQVTQGLLQQYPNLKGIISPTTVGIAAAAAVLDTAKYRGKIALTGLGTPDSLKKYVSDGTIKEFVLWKPNDLGYLAAYAAVEAASGKLNGSQGQSFTAGKLGSFTVGADKTILLGPPFTFNSANIGQFNF